MHALIIEDEGVVATSIEDVLRDCGFYSFDVVPSAEDAIIAASLRRPDIITSDVRLSPGCGIATVQAISQGTAIPTIFITGHGQEVERRLPNCSVIDKPFNVRMLTAAIASVILKIFDDDGEKESKPKINR